jgi:hypothetical protein
MSDVQGKAASPRWVAGYSVRKRARRYGCELSRPLAPSCSFCLSRRPRKHSRATRRDMAGLFQSIIEDFTHNTVGTARCAIRLSTRQSHRNRRHWQHAERHSNSAPAISAVTGPKSRTLRPASIARFSVKGVDVIFTPW